MRERAVQVGVTLVILALSVGYVSRASSWAEVSGALAVISDRRLVLLAALAVVNLVSYWLVTASVLPGLGIWRAGAVHLPANAVSNVVPAGGAIATGLHFAALRRWGYEPRRVAAAALVSGLWNNLAKLATPLVALLAFLATGNVTAGDVVLAGIATGALVGAVLVFGVVLCSERFAATLGRHGAALVSVAGRRFGRGPVTGWDAAAVKVHRDVVEVVGDRWLALTLATAVSHGALFALFVTSLHAVGLGADDIGTAELLGVFALARATTLVPLTPGGVGLLEMSMTASLAATAGSSDNVVAAVVVYRLATYVLPTALGGIAVSAWIWKAGTLWRSASPRDNTSLSRAQPDVDVPLVVDLDGTLSPVTTRSLMVARLAWTNRQGLRAYLRVHRHERHLSKLHLWETVGLDVSRAPIRRVVLRWLEAQHRDGRAIYLASGAPDAAVAAVRARYPVFRDGWGTTPTQHFVGPVKAKFLVGRFGRNGFDYVGDSFEDLAVWEIARHAILCTPSIRLERSARRRATVERVFARVPAQPLVTAVRTVAAGIRQRPGRSVVSHHLGPEITVLSPTSASASGRVDLTADVDPARG